jgi:hypothetical protein
LAINILILADRLRADFGALPGDYLPALLPVGGKSVIDYCLEDIREAGVHRAHIVVPKGDSSIYNALGAGARLGLKLSYIEADGSSGYAEAARLARQDSGALLVLRGDMLRGHCIKAIWPDRVAGSAAFYCGDRPLGIVTVDAHSDPTLALDHLIWERLQTNAPCGGNLIRLPLVGIGFSGIDSLSALHTAFKGLLEKRFAGLQPGGRFNPSNGTWVSTHADVATDSEISGTVRIGRQVKIHSATRLNGTSDIGDLAVIDRGAEISNTLVMPGTYVGRGARLENAIVWGPWLYRADLDLLQHVDDPLLLGGSIGLLSTEPSIAATPNASGSGSRVSALGMLRSTLGKFPYFGRR